ncbi:peptidyl-tRNA hydrolase 2, mitochondrial-like [Odontomachus brunneus]|uniref:peptidyl-tRNA hydrolase 2, mitochondrial-like n=1 Tax=Odontomachus brunneus TaxID=486640 RepID=UPI0013F1CE0B|nr:peptidyl-tRNA hydrolase 2, mitochondrial-like [Odontomachus brunneus]
MLLKMISPYQAMIKTISDSLTTDSKTALAIAFTFGYLIDTILRNTVLKRHRTKSSEHAENKNKRKNKNLSFNSNSDDDDEDDDDDDYDDDDDDEEEEEEDCNEYPQREEYKMVFAINSELKMGKGKVAAHCAHAAIAAFKLALKRNPSLIDYWAKSGQAKIIVKVDDEKQLMNVEQQAKKADLVAEIIRDAGRTQIPAGSKTVCVIGPAPTRLIDVITGALKLY